MSAKMVEDNDNSIVIRALRNLNGGDELSISYIEPALGVKERQAQLKGTYHFDCVCKRCTREASASNAGAASAGASDAATEEGDAAAAKRQRTD
jgi:hypothetical protein